MKKTLKLTSQFLFFAGIGSLVIISLPVLGPIGAIGGLTVTVGDCIGAIALGSLYLQVEEMAATSAGQGTASGSVEVRSNLPH